MSRSSGPTRQTILSAAYVLFRQKGFARVSLDDIAASAAVTKRTLYYHFTSKDDLLGAVLDSQSANVLAGFQTFGRSLSGTPEAIVDGLFSGLARWSEKPDWAGSGYSRLAVELADLPGHPARLIARHHKQALEGHLAEMLAAAGVGQANERAREIHLLVEGAMSMMLICSDAAYVAAAAEAAKRLLAPAAPSR